jgi:hypothetical protein
LWVLKVSSHSRAEAKELRTRSKEPYFINKKIRDQKWAACISLISLTFKG